MSETATYDGDYRAWSPGPTFAWVKVGSFIELAIFAGLLIVWLVPGMDRATFYFGAAHGIGYVALCVLIFIAILKREAPWWLLAATLTPVGPVGSVIGIEWIQRRRAKKNSEDGAMSTHIYPSLRYRDARAAIDFLERAFGFELVVAHENDEGAIGHAEMRWGNAMVMLGQETDEGIAKHGAHAGQGWNYVTVADADAHYARAKEAGAEITMELTDLDYGSRDYAARDPEGNRWSFGTYDPLAES